MHCDEEATDFDGQPIWHEGQEPSRDEVEARRIAFHAPYHRALRAELKRVRDRHGVAILFDCHSIRSNVPILFDGELPIFNTGTKNGTTCAPSIEHTVHSIATASGMSSVLNARFKGGWTTRHYGQPQARVHAIQMEISQRAYMQESPPWAYDESRANEARRHLQNMLESLSEIAQSGALTKDQE